MAPLIEQRHFFAALDRVPFGQQHFVMGSGRSNVQAKHRRSQEQMDWVSHNKLTAVAVTATAKLSYDSRNHNTRRQKITPDRQAAAMAKAIALALANSF